MSKIPMFRPGGRTANRGLALAALAVVAFAQAGCSSFGGGCGSCGEGLGSRLRGCSLFSGAGFGSRLFNHGSSACEPGCLGDSCGSGMPGGTVMPIPGPGPVMTAPGEEIDLSPAGIPSGPATTTPPAGATSSTPKSGSQAYYRANRPKPAPALARRAPAAQATTPEPANGPAAGAKSSSAADDVLANMPPIRPALEKADSTKTSPPPAEAEAIAKPSNGPASNPAAAPTASTELPPKPDEVVFYGAPGIRPFKSLSPQLSGGGEPSASGWEWLAGTGAYKTVLDLRDASVDRQAAISGTSANGLRYVSLPVSAEKIDGETVKKFLEEISTASSRPLYFFDTDGRRAAALWYIKLVSVDKLSTQEALKQAGDVGSPGPELLLASQNYLSGAATAENLKPKPAETTTAPNPTPATEPGAQVPSAATSAAVAPVREEPVADSLTWKPYAALVMTGVGVPLAFLGRSALRDHQSRASLPAPRREPRSLPASSDA